jgi:hypothetical protein
MLRPSLPGHPKSQLNPYFAFVLAGLQACAFRLDPSITDHL